ncbi:MAG: hypothetical protein KDC35_17280 [Acidobacteria bacterium]|nr:hypothetical protein [Acidobacteriota bacterium]
MIHPVWDLWILLVVIYLSECFLWLPHGTCALGGAFRWKWLRGNGLLSNENGKLIPLSPLPWATAARIPWWEVCLAKGRVCSFVPFAVPGERYTQLTECVSPAERVRVDGSSVSVGSLAIDTPSPAHACALAESLTKAKDAKRWISRRLDTGEVAVAMDRLKKHTRPVQWLSSIEWLALFAGFPGLFLGSWPLWLWLAAAGGFMGLHLITVTVFVRAHRQLYPQLGWPVKWGFLMAVAPTLAMRAPVLLSTNLFSFSHPFAVLAHCDATQASEMLHLLLRDARFPAEPSQPSDEQAKKVVSDFRKEVVRAYETAMKQMKVGEETLECGSGATYYCPRCLSEFTRQTDCHHCGGRTTTPVG